jgi:hypothetical protein
LNVGKTEIPVASYFPHCTGGFTGARSALVAATAVAASGSGGGYPLADGSRVKILTPTTNIAEENGGIGVINVTKYFARLPRSQPLPGNRNRLLKIDGLGLRETAGCHFYDVEYRKTILTSVCQN